MTSLVSTKEVVSRVVTGPLDALLLALSASFDGSINTIDSKPSVSGD